MKLTSGERAVAIMATLQYLEKGSRLARAYSQPPRMMGQMLATFFPNRAKPAMSPAVTMVKPLNTSPHRRSTRMAHSATAPELKRAGPRPARAT